MTRLFFLSATLLILGCSREPDPPAPKTKPAGPAPAQKEEAPSEAEQAPVRLALTSADFSTDKVLEGLSPKQPRVNAPTPSPAPAAEPGERHPQIRFTRVKGGDGYFCGASVDGPIHCWGNRENKVEGRYVDLALSAEGLCKIDATGSLSCDKGGVPRGAFKRVAASGRNHCALSQQGEVKCWGEDAAQPPPGMRAQFITVGDSFACAADPTRRLVCWGETAPLMLPIDALRVRDIAAGGSFLCTVSEDNDTKCFGKGPRLPPGRYLTVNAGYEQVCGIKRDGSTACAGTYEESFNEPTRRFAIGKNAICAHLTRNALDCRSKPPSPGIKPPRDTTKKLPQPGETLPAVDGETWLRFIELFPQAEFPGEFRRDSPITLGDRIPAKFEPLIGDDPNRFRSGVGFALTGDSLGFTLFDLEQRKLVLHVYNNRAKVDELTLLSVEQTSDELVEADDGTASQDKSAKSREAVVATPSTVEVTELEGTEKTKWVKKHIDGSRPVSSIDCQIQKTTWVSEVEPSGKLKRSRARVKREHGAIDTKGCTGRAPFD